MASSKISALTALAGADVADADDLVVVDTSAGSSGSKRIAASELRDGYLKTGLRNIAATTAPGVGDDSDDGYQVGSVWCDVTGDAAYVCVDPTVGAAVWLEIGNAGSLQLSDLTDVGVTTATNRNALMADGDSWESRAIVEADVSDLGSYLTTETVVLSYALGDETTAATTGTAVVTVRAPFAFTLTDVRASAVTAPTGSVATFDINESGTTVLSTKLTIDATEKTSTTAAAAAVISDSAIADDAEITIDIDGVGSTVAGAGYKITLIGTKP